MFARSTGLLSLFSVLLARLTLPAKTRKIWSGFYIREEAMAYLIFKAFISITITGGVGIALLECAC